MIPRKTGQAERSPIIQKRKAYPIMTSSQSLRMKAVTCGSVLMEVEYAVMMAHHLHILRKRMAYPVIGFLPYLRIKTETCGSEQGEVEYAAMIPMRTGQVGNPCLPCLAGRRADRQGSPILHKKKAYPMIES